MGWLTVKKLKKAAVACCLASVLCGMIPAAYASSAGEDDASPPDDLLVHYTFDHTSGSTAADSSLHGHDGVLVGGASWSSEGKTGAALDLNGVNGYVKLPNGILSDQKDLTIATWIKADSLGTWARIFDFGTDTTNRMFMTLKDNGGVIRFAALPQGGQEEVLTGPAYPASGAWQHVAVVISENTYSLYLNGIQVSRISNIQNFPSAMGETTSNFIGKSQYTADPYFDGKMDDFRIYGRALSASDLIELITESMSDTEIVAYDKNALDLGDTSQLTSDLELPLRGNGGSVIRWASSNHEVVDPCGKVHRPRAGDGDGSAVLTATITKGIVQDTKAFEVTVWEEGATAYSLDINGKDALHDVSPTLYGIFYEDINYAGDGGLYGELVQNRSFEFGSPLYAWSNAGYGGAAGTVTTATASPLNANNPRYARITVTKPGDGFGLMNAGYSGIAVTKGEHYNFTFYARSGNTLAKPVTVQLRSAAGAIHGACEITGVAADWKKFGCTLPSDADDTNARLVVLTSEEAVIDVDMVSLFPEKTWQNRSNGLRYDLAEMLDDMNPSFLRFPGGCIVEGGSIENRYKWKNTIGDVANRQVQRNQWAGNYYQSFGLGFHEYFQLSEDIGAEPLPIIFIGQVSCHSNPPKIPMDQLGPYVQDALDLIEYANGDVTTEWGALRAANGHPEPFHLKYIGVGNELWGQDYLNRYEAFYDAIKAKHPEIQLVLSAGYAPDDNWFHFAYDWLGKNGNKADLVDEHMYQSPEWFYNNANRYDHYDRNGPKVFVGEFAAHGVGKRNNLESALAEAAFMTGLERNSDVVAMASYAPLFARQGFTQWTPDLIWFDNHQSLATPNYYVQQLFAGHLGNQVMPSELVKQKQSAAERVKGSIVLGSWSTAVEYDDLAVTGADGEILLKHDFNDAAELQNWSNFKGAWSVGGGVLKQTSASTTDARLTLNAGQDWTDYSLSLKARKSSGAEGFLIGFGAQDIDNYYWWNLGGFGNTKTVIEKAANGAKTTISNNSDLLVEPGRWYNIRIDINGSLIRCYLDGELIQEADVSPGPLYSVTTKDDKTGDLIVKTVNISGSKQATAMRIDADYIHPEAEIIELKSVSAAAENDLGQPEEVSPAVRTITDAGKEFTYEFPAYSVTIMRLRTNSNPVVSGVETVNVLTSVGKKPILPQTVTVEKSDGTKQSIAVEWAKIDEEQVAKTGVFQLKGTLPGSYRQAKAVVQVLAAASGPVLSGPSTATEGDSFEVIYGLPDAPPGTLASDLTVVYNPDHLQYMSAEVMSDDVLLAGEANTANAGERRFALVHLDDGNGNVHYSELLKLTFRVKELSQATDSAISLRQVVTADGDGTETAWESGSPLQLQLLMRSGASGDLNGDGKFTVGDLAIAAARYGATSADPNWNDIKNADMNHDGKIDIADLSAIARLILS